MSSQHDSTSRVSGRKIKLSHKLQENLSVRLKRKPRPRTKSLQHDEFELEQNATTQERRSSSPLSTAPSESLSAVDSDGRAQQDIILRIPKIQTLRLFLRNPSTTEIDKGHMHVSESPTLQASDSSALENHRPPQIQSESNNKRKAENDTVDGPCKHSSKKFVLTTQSDSSSTKASSIKPPSLDSGAGNQMAVSSEGPKEASQSHPDSLLDDLSAASHDRKGSPTATLVPKTRQALGSLPKSVLSATLSAKDATTNPCEAVVLDGAQDTQPLLKTVSQLKETGPIGSEPSPTDRRMSKGSLSTAEPPLLREVKESTTSLSYRCFLCKQKQPAYFYISVNNMTGDVDEQLSRICFACRRQQSLQDFLARHTRRLRTEINKVDKCSHLQEQADAISFYVLLLESLELSFDLETVDAVRTPIYENAIFDSLDEKNDFPDFLADKSNATTAKATKKRSAHASATDHGIEPTQSLIRYPSPTPIDIPETFASSKFAAGDFQLPIIDGDLIDFRALAGCLHTVADSIEDAGNQAMTEEEREFLVKNVFRLPSTNIATATWATQCSDVVACLKSKNSRKS